MSALGIVFSIVGAAVAKHIGTSSTTSATSSRPWWSWPPTSLSFAIFWVLKYLAFNRLFQVHPLEELDELVEAA